MRWTRREKWILQDGGTVDLEEVEGVPTSGDVISTMGYLAFSTQDASPGMWGS